MRQSALAAAALLCLGPAAAFADTPGLDPALQRLLAAAAGSKAGNDFADAVRLLALTSDAQAILAAADALGRKGEAREALGLEPAPAAPRDAAAAAARGETPMPAKPDDARGWTAAPAALASAVYGAQSDLWDGRVKFAMRFDGGNSDREDFAGAIELERALMGWGFEGGVEYAYSRIDGQVGRDELIAQARGERRVQRGGKPAQSSRVHLSAANNSSTSRKKAMRLNRTHNPQKEGSFQICASSYRGSRRVRCSAKASLLGLLRSGPGPQQGLAGAFRREIDDMQ